MDLRRLRESTAVLMIPVYTFIVSTFVLLTVGIVRILSGSLPYHAPAHLGASIGGVTLILILKAFSTGSSSLTGVEAISNAVPFFKRPKEHNAALTLVMMGSILAVFFAGVVFFAYWMGLVPGHNITVIAQMANGLLGESPIGHVMFFIFQFSTALILAVAANTGYSAFPVLAFNMAKNKYMPHMFTARGDRLSYSNGIISLAAGAIVLLVIFKGQTERLIPLYAIGVFTPFTLAQVGMVVHWKKKLGNKFIFHSIPNIIGALISFSVVMILLIFRTLEIWPFFLVLPLLIFAFLRVHHHYVTVAEQLRLREGVAEHKFDGNTVIVLVGNMTNVDLGAINYARSIGDYVIALHVSTKENTQKEQEIETEFKSTFPDLHLTVIQTNYRDIIAPAARYIGLTSKDAKKRNFTTTVIIPNFIPSKPWENMFHNQTGLRLRMALNSHEDIILASYNYHLKK